MNTETGKGPGVRRRGGRPSPRVFVARQYSSPRVLVIVRRSSVPTIGIRASSFGAVASGESAASATASTAYVAGTSGVCRRRRRSSACVAEEEDGGCGGVEALHGGVEAAAAMELRPWRRSCALRHAVASDGGDQGDVDDEPGFL